MIDEIMIVLLPKVTKAVKNRHGLLPPNDLTNRLVILSSYVR